MSDSPSPSPLDFEPVPSRTNRRDRVDAQAAADIGTPAVGLAQFAGHRELHELRPRRTCSTFIVLV